MSRMRELIDRFALLRAVKPALGQRVGIFWQRSTLGVVERVGWLGLTLREPDGDTIVIRWHAIQGWEMGDEISAMFDERLEKIAARRDQPEPALTEEEQMELLMEVGR
jgi:hypothetical protein